MPEKPNPGNRACTRHLESAPLSTDFVEHSERSHRNGLRHDLDVTARGPDLRRLLTIPTESQHILAGTKCLRKLQFVNNCRDLPIWYLSTRLITPTKSVATCR